MNRVHRSTRWEDDEDRFPEDARYTLGDGIAWRIYGWETEPDEDTEWSGYQVRTGRVIAVMVGDDQKWSANPDDFMLLGELDYCAECGSSGSSNASAREDGMAKKERKAQDQRKWAEKLRAFLAPGQTVDCVLRHVSRSGMQRRIDLYARSDDGPVLISGMAAAAMGERWDSVKGGIVVGGCGMDMGFHLVYNLSYTLWPNGFGCIGERCRSNDHSNGDRDYTPHPGCGTADARGHRDHWHNDGGYALRHNWL